ncbi:MAG TPA: chemotaxis protein CheX [Verrucomicrobiae bacterium]
MSQVISVPDIRQYVCGHLQSVFDTMLSLKTSLVAEGGAGTINGLRVTGTVGMAGETVNGLVYLHLPAGLAAHAAATMVGLTPEDLGEAEVNDVIGEVTNMVAGGLKSWLCDAGAKCALTTPAIIRGDAFHVIAKPGVEVMVIPFECESQACLAEVHVKFI